MAATVKPVKIVTPKKGTPSDQAAQNSSKKAKVKAATIPSVPHPVEESLRRACRQVKEGKTRPISELWDRIDEH